jgi:membrane protein YqaA with SNARE-associated domain
LKSFLHKYTTFLLHWVAPLGPFGVLVLAALDAAAYGLPIDVVVAGFVYSHPAWSWIYVFMAAVGSAAGSLVIYGIGYKGEEVLLEKRFPPERVESLRRRFEDREFLALLVPAILPPPTPFKLFLLAAGAFRMRVRDFLLAVFSGRLIRFAILAVLVRYFGPEIVRTAGELFRQHFWWALAVVIVLIVGGVLLWRKPWKAAASASR